MHLILASISEYKKCNLYTSIYSSHCYQKNFFILNSDNNHKIIFLNEIMTIQTLSHFYLSEDTTVPYKAIRKHRGQKVSNED